MGSSHPEAPPADPGDPRKTPPLRSGSRTLMRAIAIVSVFVFAGSMTLWVRFEEGDSFTVWWVELLVVPAFVLGVIVAAADYLWQRQRR